MSSTGTKYKVVAQQKMVLEVNESETGAAVRQGGGEYPVYRNSLIGLFSYSPLNLILFR